MTRQGPDNNTSVAAIEDKIVQKAVTEAILTPIYEAEFMWFSYGFRSGRGAHDALDALAVGITRRKNNWVFDCGMWLGRVYQGCFNYFAVPGTGRCQRQW